ncbi:small ribosomal subunit protein uS17m [Drosophila suzukii]|uniref:Small ribosomal subunit protein uS17m n=1 Tax=Drosophila suzukii TaxID=28584 RepID=A0AB39Z3X0_DROSZ|nr:28S ribosomal protein S17, mitochondrial [Drosophila suzukii]XP_037714188.1 28S ribosomal protein S17, mitochondrial [Drosophila subpulchrella]
MSRRGLLLMGQCMPCIKQNASKIRIRRMELDKNLNMYFKKDEFYFAHDPQKVCKTGDVVLIRELPERLTRLITHNVEKVVYPLGDITDPLTGKKVVVGKYREDIEMANQLFGKAEKAFDYEKAPPRGRLEGTKDFTHGETYIKYHEDGKDQPFAV